MSIDLDSQKQQLANCIAGQVIPDQPGLAVCIRGNVKGFPVILQAVLTGWPFGVMYISETQDSATVSAVPAENGGRITICPRVGKGLGSILSFLFLFEGKSMPVGDSELEGQFNFSYDRRDLAYRFAAIEGIASQIKQLEQQTKFSELVIRTDAGIYLAQPTPFEKLSPEDCLETCRLLADMGSLLRQNF